MKQEIYQNLMEDMYKIKMYAADANHVKKNQPVNNRYTTIHSTMLAIFFFLKLSEKEYGKLNAANDMIQNALMVQLVNFSTGNMGVDSESEKQIKIYHNVKKKIISEKIEFLNRNLKEIKIPFVEIQEDESIFLFCEQLADLWILKQLYMRGNELAYTEIEKKISILTNYSDYEIKEVQKIKSKLPQILENLKNRQKLKQWLNKDEDLKDYENLATVIFNLREVHRFSQAHLIVPQDVLFHLYLNTVICLIMTDWLEKQGEELDKAKILLKSLLHDFGEYTGNEIIASTKAYSLETSQMFEKIEENDERKLKEKIGLELFEIIKKYKTDKEGYVVNIIDKMIGIMKTKTELILYSNKTMLKCFTATECKRFQTFYTNPIRDELKLGNFYTTLLKSHYISIIECFLKQEEMKIYWNEKEIEALKASIEYEKELLKEIIE